MSWVFFRKVFTSLLVFLNILSIQLIAGEGTSSGEFLKISPYSRGAAVGGAWVAVAEGAGALYYNPAGIGRRGIGEISVSHSQLYQDLKLENLGIAYPLGSGSGIGFGVNYLGYGSIEGYDVQGNSTGVLSAYSMCVNVAFSQRLTDEISIGAAVKPVFERLGSFSARTITADLGVIADLGQFSLGAQMANWGGSLKFVNERVGLPKTINVGAAYRTLGGGSIISLGATRSNEGLFSMGSGIEYHYNGNLALRVGYSSSLQNQTATSGGLSFGVGLNVSPVGIDYSYRPSSSLDGIHQITASYRFGK